MKQHGAKYIQIYILKQQLHTHSQKQLARQVNKAGKEQWCM